MIEYQPEGLITDEPVLVAMFLGWPGDGHIYRIHSQQEQFDLGEEGWCREVTIPHALVWEAIQPVEGEGYVYDAPDLSITAELTVFRKYNADPRMHGNDYSRVYFHKRVLNIVTTRAELRELVARCKGEKDETN